AADGTISHRGCRSHSRSGAVTHRNGSRRGAGMKRALLSLAAVVLAACATRPAAPDAASASPTAAASTQQMSSHGLAGWIGQEFAGRTTANGEIFDPMLMTASHRTLPFGTLLDVHNA